MLLGISANLQEQKRIVVERRIVIVTTIFLGSVILPFAIYLLFLFNIVGSKSAFSSDIQEPVAKVLTGSGVGTAFLISPTILITARHVVENKKVGDQVDLIFEKSKNQYQTKATIKFIAPVSTRPIDGIVPIEYFLSDVAVLEMTKTSDLEPLVLGESDAVQNLDEVILIGFPNGDYSITKGNINSDQYQGVNLFKLDAASNPGNSGGPCFLKDDNTVIGILVGGKQPGTQGENIALKINTVKDLLRKSGIDFSK